MICIVAKRLENIVFIIIFTEKNLAVKKLFIVFITQQIQKQTSLEK